MSKLTIVRKDIQFNDPCGCKTVFELTVMGEDPGNPGWSQGYVNKVRQQPCEEHKLKTE